LFQHLEGAGTAAGGKPIPFFHHKDGQFNSRDQNQQAGNNQKKKPRLKTSNLESDVTASLYEDQVRVKTLLYFIFDFIPISL
jgi:hypothetical protein